MWSRGYLVAGPLLMDSVPPLDFHNPLEEACTTINIK